MAQLPVMANNSCYMLPWIFCFMSLLDGALGARKETTAPVLDPATSGICESRVEIYGYECEEHSVTTDDGYILSIQRISNGQSGGGPGGQKIPVLLQHGLLVDGITWLINSPEESLGYILADEGFDVWIANGRGTTYSRQHTSILPNDPAYWEWSYDALVDYDLPAIFTYVYSQTGKQRFHYVGHSQGTLIALASFSEHRLLYMIRSAALLSPVAYLNHVESPIAQGVADTFIGEAFYWLGLNEFNPIGKTVQTLLQDICDQPGVNCDDLITVITGKNCCINSSSIQVFFEHEPQPTATKNIIQLAQMIRRGTIAKYDYDNYIDNMKHYGQPFPPAYRMSAIPNDLPLFLSYGGQDFLSDVMDVHHLLDDLQSHDMDKLTVQYVANYAHGDFVLAFNAKQVVYDFLIAFFKLQ